VLEVDTSSESRRSTSDLPAQEDVRSLQRVLTLFQKAFNAVRLYGPTNHLVQQFTQQLYNNLTAHLAAYGSFTIQARRHEFFYQGKMVYETPSEAGGLAYKLYLDGVCELTFSPGITLTDLSSFVAVLGAEDDPDTSDHDIVTRLWQHKLISIAIVTAEELVKSTELANALIPQESETVSSSLSRLQEVIATPVASQTTSESHGGSAPNGSVQAADSDLKEGTTAQTATHGEPTTRESARVEKTHGRVSPDVLDVSRQELDQVTKRIRTESMRDNTAYFMELIKAVLTSEDAVVLFSEILDVARKLLHDLVRLGNWRNVNALIEILREEQSRTDLHTNYQEALLSVLESLNEPDCIKAIESALNANEDTSTKGLLELLQNLGPNAFTIIGELLGQLKFKAHRLSLCETLSFLARSNPAFLIQGLTDSRWYVVRNFLYVIGKVGDPGLASQVERLLSHPHARVRREALHTLRIMRPSGKGNHLVVLLNDPDEEMRKSALSLLKTGKYSTPTDLWESALELQSLLPRPLSEVRTIFQVLGLTLGNEAVSYLRRFVTMPLWVNRKVKEELGVLAAEALGKLGTPAAVRALQDGQKRFNRAIRNASARSLETILRK
jgi:HEAT repeat protein